MYKFLSAMLIAFAISSPAQADVFGFFSSDTVLDATVEGRDYAPSQSTVVDGSIHGYPFYSGCCDSKSSHCEGLWDGFCGSRSCGMKSARLRHYGHLKGGFGCSHSPLVYGGKGGCTACEHAGAPRGKSSWGHLSYRGLGGKGGCGNRAHCGCKGGDVCSHCGPKHCRLGLFDWMHFGRGHGCNVCGEIGCKACGGGKGGSLEFVPNPVQGYDKSYYHTPTEAEENLTPPEVLVEPASILDRSAWRRPVPVNPLARPFN